MKLVLLLNRTQCSAGLVWSGVSFLDEVGKIFSNTVMAEGNHIHWGSNGQRSLVVGQLGQAVGVGFRTGPDFEFSDVFVLEVGDHNIQASFF
jgi:hypothetical protein